MEKALVPKMNYPDFQDIDPDNVLSSLRNIIKEIRAGIKERLEEDNLSFENLVKHREELEDELNKFWAPVSHLNAVSNNEAIRKAHSEGLVEITNLQTEIDQNSDLYAAYRQIENGDFFSHLKVPEQKVVLNAIRDFHLTGIDLPVDQKKKLSELKKEISILGTDFSNNVLDSTQAWNKQVSDVSELSGVPENALALMKQAAKNKELDGYLLTLEMPCYRAVIVHCDNRRLREELYMVYGTRATEFGPGAAEFDNSGIVPRLLNARRKLADILGFKNYAELSTSKKMAESPEQIISFLRELSHRAKPQALGELKAVRDYAKKIDDMDELEPWDVTYYSEKLRQDLFDISEDFLRPYFPVPKVLTGLYEVINRLFDLNVKEIFSVSKWHDDVQTFEISRNGMVIAGFYLDLYARENKRGGAWMAECMVRRSEKSDMLQLPVAFLTCNFSGPVGNKSALLSHEEVITLFHEFGHGLHHMLTQIDVAPVSGINGVSWDAVELPSQFMENYCWEKEALAFISGHIDSGNPLPDHLLEKLIEARNFNSAMAMVRQLEFALFDMRLHVEFDPDQENQVERIMQEVREEVAVVKPPQGYSFENSFSHIFSGGYAAGYYSYKWAEVLSADAYSKFQESGVFNRQTGERFLASILERGGSVDASDLFFEFMGREPRIDALLEQNGIS